MHTKGLSVKNVVAIGIGSAIYVILARFTSIPTPIPNTNIELVFPFLALFASIYGAKVGFIVGCGSIDFYRCGRHCCPDDCSLYQKQDG